MIRYRRDGVNISLSGVAGFPARQRNTFTNKKGVCGMSTYFHNKLVGGIARVILSVALAVVFTALVLTGCAKDDYGGLLDSKLICANGEAWIMGDMAMVFSENEAYTALYKNFGVWNERDWPDDFWLRWRTEGKKLIWFKLSWNEPTLTWDYAEQFSATYRISDNGDTLELWDLKGVDRYYVVDGVFIKGSR